MQGIQIIELLDATPPLAQADVLHINKASNSNDEKSTIGDFVRDKTVANLIQGSTQLIDNGSTANALVFDIESGIVDLESAETRVFYFTAPFTSTGTGTFTINGVTGVTNLPSKIMKKGVLANIKAGTIVINQIYQVFIDGGNAIFTTSSGGLSTSYNGAVVNAATSVITLTNADTDIDSYEVFKQGVKITITPNITTTANAVVTLSGSNLTNTPIFAKDIVNNTYAAIGLLQQLTAGLPFEVVYIDNQPSVNGGLPFLLANDFSGQGFVIEVEAFQQYTSNTVTNTITLAPINGFPDTAYINLQVIRFTADISNTGDWFAKFPALASKQIVDSVNLLPLVSGQIVTTRQYEMRFDSTLDKWILILYLISATQEEFFNKSASAVATPSNIANDVRNERYSVGNAATGLNQVLPSGNVAVGTGGYNILTGLLQANEDQRSNIAIPYRTIANAVQTKYLDEVNNKFVFPSNLFTYNNNNTTFTIRVTATVNIPSTNNTTIKFYIRLIRVVDNSVISVKAGSQSDFAAQTGVIITVEFKTFVESETDPFVLNGVFIDMLNDSSSASTVTLTNAAIRIFKD